MVCERALQSFFSVNAGGLKVILIRISLGMILMYMLKFEKKIKIFIQL